MIIRGEKNLYLRFPNRLIGTKFNLNEIKFMNLIYKNLVIQIEYGGETTY